MQSTISFSRGDIVVVPFPFTEQRGSKKRPALIVSSDEYNSACPDVIIAQITSRLKAPPRPGDHQVKEWQEAGLLGPSLVRARLATLQKGIVIRRLGHMSREDMANVDRSLMTALALVAA